MENEMKSEEALQIVKGLGEEFPKYENAMFSALVEDTKKMDDRMSTLEKSVKEVQSDVRDIKDNLETISKKVEALVNRKNFWGFLSELIAQPKFWLWFSLFTLLVFGVRESGILSFLKG